MAGRDTTTVERRGVIGAPLEQVYAAIVDLRRWQHWSPWEGRDPDMERSYSGADAGVGAVYAWSGNREVGEGRMEITSVEEPSAVALELRFLEPFTSQSTTTFGLEPADGGTRVTWTMSSPTTFMTRVVGILMSMDAMIGQDFEQGLEQLDAHLRA